MDLLKNHPHEIVLLTDTKGNVKATLEAINLENSPKIFDPVKGKYVEGNHDWDRFYGNYVYMEIDNDSRIFQNPHIEQIEIAVRVLHVIKQEDIPEEPSFSKDISKLLFSYYLRYFPWLHAREQPEIPKEVPISEIKDRDTYFRFPNLETYEEMKDSEVVSGLIKRLSLDNNEFRKMPRSRDFPIGGIELLQRWLDKGMPK